jgi:hypothetical protein
MRCISSFFVHLEPIKFFYLTIVLQYSVHVKRVREVTLSPRIRAQCIIVLSRRRNVTMFGYNSNGTDSKWTQAGRQLKTTRKI